MTKKQITALALCLTALGLSSCAYNEEPGRPPGHYEHNTSHVDRHGTRVERNQSTDVEVDRDGYRHTRRRVETTRDPKGLFNKKTTSESYESDGRRN